MTATPSPSSSTSRDTSTTSIRRMLLSATCLLLGCAFLRVSQDSTNNPLSWHIKPIHPHHHGDVIFLTEKLDAHTYRYKREFTVPCGDGVLVFNIGPALENQPYAYDIYQDNYAYSDNSGLCVLYPSYKGEQTAEFPLWGENDPTQQSIALGDTPNKISTRVVKPPQAKSFDANKRGGDFCIMRSGNFYNPTYYKQLKHEINMWPETIQSIPEELNKVVERLHAQMDRPQNPAIRGGTMQQE